MLDLDPPQPPEVMRVLEELLGADEPAPDPWWAEGLADALEGPRQADAAD